MRRSPAVTSRLGVKLKRKGSNLSEHNVNLPAALISAANDNAFENGTNSYKLPQTAPT
jgi:hypothetical protein